MQYKKHTPKTTKKKPSQKKITIKKKKLTKTKIKECLRFWFGKLYIRLRDTDKDGYGYCISSGKKLYWTEGQGGHYIPNGSCKIHTRNEDNVHLQSMQDNVLKNGNILWYRPELIDKIGIAKVEYFESTKNDTKQRKEWEYLELINKYKQKVYDMIPIKSPKVQQEIHEYIKKNDKKMWSVMYADQEIIPKDITKDIKN